VAWRQRRQRGPNPPWWAVALLFLLAPLASAGTVWLAFRVVRWLH
jgi:hypothetical protein